MKKGIAVLLQGGPSDLAAAMQGIELARRTTSKMHCVFIGLTTKESAISLQQGILAGRPGKMLQFIDRLCDQARIRINWHELDDVHEESLMEFLKRYRICCLIIGAPDQSGQQKSPDWLKKLPERLAKDHSWFQLAFWVLEAKAWDDGNLDRTLEKWSSDPVY